jgi:HD superfamily phosphohydrolase
MKSEEIVSLLLHEVLYFLNLYIIHNEIRKRKANWIGHILRRNCLLKQVIEGKIEADRSDKKTRKKT